MKDFARNYVANVVEYMDSDKVKFADLGACWDLVFTDKPLGDIKVQFTEGDATVIKQNDKLIIISSYEMATMIMRSFGSDILRAMADIADDVKFKGAIK